jgi:hypothetical protein
VLYFVVYQLLHAHPKIHAAALNVMLCVKTAVVMHDVCCVTCPFLANLPGDVVQIMYTHHFAIELHTICKSIQQHCPTDKQWEEARWQRLLQRGYSMNTDREAGQLLASLFQLGYHRMLAFVYDKLHALNPVRFKYVWYEPLRIQLVPSGRTASVQYEQNLIRCVDVVQRRIYGTEEHPLPSGDIYHLCEGLLQAVRNRLWLLASYWLDTGFEWSIGDSLPHAADIPAHLLQRMLETAQRRGFALPKVHLNAGVRSAARSGLVENVRLLLAANADVTSACLGAAEENQELFMRAMYPILTRGQKSEWGAPILNACFSNHTRPSRECVLYLVRHENVIPSHENIETAVTIGDEELFVCMYNTAVNNYVNFGTDTLNHWLQHTRCPGVMKKLLHVGAHPQALLLGPQHFACASSFFNAADSVLSKEDAMHCIPPIGFHAAMMTATKVCRSLPYLEWLLSKGAPVNFDLYMELNALSQSHPDNIARADFSRMCDVLAAHSEGDVRRNIAVLQLVKGVGR